MNIERLDLTVRDLVAGYRDDGDDGVVGYGGKLDIRPPYQREFIYEAKERNAVIDSILKGFPLNVMYWSDRGDGTYEIIDGQQRTISIAQYVENEFSILYESKEHYFHSLPIDIQNSISDYKLMVYVCSGTDSERLNWFKIINIAGKKLTNQELRNAVYAGPWVTNAKRYFSRRGCPAASIGSDYLNGKPNRQEFLETAIEWKNKGKIDDYMTERQQDKSAVSLWNYFQSVISWVKATFTKKRRFMKSVNWGRLYDEFKDANLDPERIEKETARLLLDDDVTKKAGIYPYILTRNEKHLNIRAFSAGMKQKVYEKQNGICAICKEQFVIGQMEADHITPWSEGGKTNEENCQMLCRDCNREKSSK